MASIPMSSARTVSGNQPLIRRLSEKAGGVFLAGVPVMVEVASGYLKEWDGATIVNGIAGVCKEFASNLASNGVAQTLTFGQVPNESAAVNIPRGAPLNDGANGVELATLDTIFHGEVGPAQTPAQTDIGKQYGMTKDSDNHWYVDRTKSTVGTNTVVTVVDFDTNKMTLGGLAGLADARGVYFQFTIGASQGVA